MVGSGSSAMRGFFQAQGDQPNSNVTLPRLDTVRDSDWVVGPPLQMKINPPKLSPEQTAPYRDALFGRQGFGDAITNLVRNTEESLVVFVNAPWGAGKTTFALMWREYLRSQKLDAIYFDAYAYDYFEDPFVSFSGEILTFVDSNLKAAGEAPRRELKKAAVEIGKGLAGVAVKAALKIGTAGLVGASELDEVRDAVSDAGDTLGKFVEKLIDEHTKEKAPLNVFREKLARVAQLVREQHGFPLTIIVDELDRCRPDFALLLIERIKHLFDVPNVAFILLVHRAQIEACIRQVYGEKVDASDYLLKFGNVFVDLPDRALDEYNSSPGRAEYCQALFDHFKMPVPSGDRHALIATISALSNHLRLPLRQMEKIFTVLSLYYGGSRLPHQADDPLLIAVLASLKVADPETYGRLAAGKIAAREFFNITDLEKMEDRPGLFSREHLIRTIHYFLAEDESTAKALRLEQWSFSADRTRVIPSFCARLDRFSTSPAAWAAVGPRFQ